MKIPKLFITFLCLASLPFAFAQEEDPDKPAPASGLLRVVPNVSGTVGDLVNPNRERPRQPRPPEETTNPVPAADLLEVVPNVSGAVGELVSPVRERPRQAPPSKETAKRLAEPEKRDRTAETKAAQTIKDEDDASRLIKSILGAAGSGAVTAKIATNGQNTAAPGKGGDPRQAPGYAPSNGNRYQPPPRLSEGEVGRTQRDREHSVAEMTLRFGGKPIPPGAGRTGDTGTRVAPPSPNYRPDQQVDRQSQVGQQGTSSRRSAPTYYEGNRRVVHYSSRSEIPPIIVANSYFNRVEVVPAHQARYRPISGSPHWSSAGERPDAYYQSQSAYAVSYQVDPNSVVSRDDILFLQGSTAFADAYSYDLVIDIAEAMNHPNLYNETFIVEGHASAEGSYSSNLHLSQMRAERIAQELVRYGVAPERLLPVGYGESEAAYPADAPEHLRRLDRRVVIFRMQ